MTKLKSMKVFSLAIEQGSIVRAAKLLNISKAAASKHIIDLENNLNAQLLQRTTRSLKLTEVGALYYDSVKKIFLAIHDSESIVEKIHEKPIGTLRITSHRYFGEKYIVNHLKKFIDRYPTLKIDFELADRFPDLVKENIDILCGVGHEGPDHLVRRKISSAYHILCASPEYLSKYGTPKIPDDIKSHQYITHSFRNPDNLLTFNNGKEINIDYSLRVNDSQAMMRFALQGLGIIRIHNYIAEQSINDGKLIEILKKYREPEKSIYVFYQKQNIIQTKVRLFLDFLYEIIKHN